MDETPENGTVCVELLGLVAPAVVVVLVEIPDDNQRAVIGTRDGPTDGSNWSLLVTPCRRRNCPSKSNDLMGTPTLENWPIDWGSTCASCTSMFCIISLNNDYVNDILTYA